MDMRREDIRAINRRVLQRAKSFGQLVREFSIFFLAEDIFATITRLSRYHPRLASLRRQIPDPNNQLITRVERVILLLNWN